MENNFHVIIPARYQSTRLPAKALASIGDKSMIELVCGQAALSGAKSITVATDHQDIKDVVCKAGFDAIITDLAHPSGSDRVFQAAQLIGLLDSDIIVNVQGDEPFIPPQNIAQVAALLAQSGSSMSTLCTSIASVPEALDPNVVKVVFANNKKAIYFSRSVIPFNRDNPLTIDKPMLDDYFRHIGIYAYRKQFLQKFIAWPQGVLEKLESLEQLRVLENGYEISIECLSISPPPGIDTPHDLEAARRFYSKKT